MAWLFLSAAIASEVVATLSLRASDGFTRVAPAIVVVVGYLASFVFLALALKRGLGIGVAYAVWAGVGVAAVAVLARLLFDEPLTWVTAVGILTIVVGVALVELSTESA